MASELLGTEPGFARMHPASLVFGIGRHLKPLIVPAVLVVFFASGSRWEAWLAVLFLPSSLIELWRYFTTQYRVTEDELVVKRGAVFRSERHIPLGRIQNIDLVQNPLHRMLGVAEARVETGAGTGSEPEAVFKVLSLEAIARLRGRVAPRGGRVAGEMSEQARSDVLLRLGVGEIVKLGLMSNRGMALVAVAIGAAWEFGLLNKLHVWSYLRTQAAHWNSLASLLTALALMVGAFVLLRLLSAAWMLLHFYGYELRRDGEDLRITCGLFTRVTATLPRRRIQLVSVRQTALQRWLGFSSIRVETAGSTGHEDGEGERGTLSRAWFVPMVRENEVPRLLDEVRPGLGGEWVSGEWSRPAAGARPRMVKKSLVGVLPIAAVLTVVFFPWGAVSLAVLAPLAVWRARREAAVMAYAATPTGMRYRSGAWTVQTSQTFFDKMQALSLHESPFDRRHRMAAVTIDTAGAGPAGHQVSIRYMMRDDAETLLRRLMERAGRTRYSWR